MAPGSKFAAFSAARKKHVRDRLSRRRRKRSQLVTMKKALRPFAAFDFVTWRRLACEPTLFVMRDPMGRPPDSIGVVDSTGAMMLTAKEFAEARRALGLKPFPVPGAKK